MDEKYNTIHFNFMELPSHNFFIKAEWSKENLIGYLNSWSSVQHFIAEKKYNPIDEIINEVNLLWKYNIQVIFPLFLKIGKINKG